MLRLPWGAALDDEDINEKWDRWWGLRISEVEWNLSRQTGASGSAASLTPPDQQRTWIGFRPSTFLTPYAELDQIVQASACGPGSRWIDLGAGYGRLAWVLEAYEVGHEFLGLEVVSERVQEGRSAMETCGLNRSQLLQQDLQDPDVSSPSGGLLPPLRLRKFGGDSKNPGGSEAPEYVASERKAIPAHRAGWTDPKLDR
jgi:hypothetical protein